MIEDSFRNVASITALGLEAVVILTIVIGAVEAVYQVARYQFKESATGGRLRLWMGFARWLVLALEFALAADIVRTAIAPSWDDIGKLAAIAAIRTLLGFFLERDIDAFDPDERE